MHIKLSWISDIYAYVCNTTHSYTVVVNIGYIRAYSTCVDVHVRHILLHVRRIQFRHLQMSCISDIYAYVCNTTYSCAVVVNIRYICALQMYTVVLIRHKQLHVRRIQWRHLLSCISDIYRRACQTYTAACQTYTVETSAVVVHIRHIRIYVQQDLLICNCRAHQTYLGVHIRHTQLHVRQIQLRHSPFPCIWSQNSFEMFRQLQLQLRHIHLRRMQLSCITDSCISDVYSWYLFNYLVCACGRVSCARQVGFASTWYRVAPVSRLLKMTGLFCKRAL